MSLLARRRAGLRLFVLAAFGFAAASPAFATIGYTVSLASPDQHLFHVTMTVPVEGRETVVAMPAWNTLYQIRDFALRVRDLNANCPAAVSVPLAVRAIDKQTWRVSLEGACQPENHNSFEIRYSVLWNDPGPFNSQLNARHAFVNLAQILMYVPDRRAENTTLEFDDLAGDWDTGAQLDSGAAPHSYVAPSYDALVDAPVEVGKFERFDFTSGGAQFHVMVDASSWNRNMLDQALRAITAYQLQLMGGPPPFTTNDHAYTFIFHIGPDGNDDGGGMEHANCTAIAALSTEAAAVTAAHEFFHVWNVKRIRPQALEPVDYSKEQYTRALWFAEGVTSAYALLTLERTGLWTKKQFYAELSAQIGDLQARPAREWQTVEESSLDAWLEKYPDYNLPDRSVSYYNKGEIVGLMLDLAIRDATENRKSLDDVMRIMNAEYARQHRFYNESESVRAAVDEVAGKDFGDFFHRYVSGAGEIPYNQFLGVAGLELKADSKNDDRYTVRETENPTNRQRHILDGWLRGTTD
jgi:predicted metalloprotease with PDZ domain